MANDIYLTIRNISEGIYKEKGSRFVSFAFPVSGTEQVKQIIERTRKEHHEARHHCYAYMIGHERTQWRANDDGEPSGTAGKPILGQINSKGLTNILIIVCRYFGGTLLGTSGLINAYRTAAAAAIGNAEITEKTVQEMLELVFPYDRMNDVMKLLKEENIEHTVPAFDLECRITISYRISIKDRILERLGRIEGLEYHSPGES